MEVADHDSDELVLVETMRERKAEMDRRAGRVPGAAGGIGTLEEFFEVWTAASLGMHAKPVVVLDPDGTTTRSGPGWPTWRSAGSSAGRRSTRCCSPAPVDDALAAVETGRLP
jgi:hypothetical protein